MVTYVIPPAFVKIVQLVRERILHDFKHHRQDPAEGVVAQDQSLAEPAKGMSQHELVKDLALKREKVSLLDQLVLFALIDFGDVDI